MGNCQCGQNDVVRSAATKRHAGRRILKRMQERSESAKSMTDIGHKVESSISGKEDCTITIKCEGSPSITMGGKRGTAEHAFLERYAFKRILGAGAYSQVFLAEVKDRERDCNEIPKPSTLKVKASLDVHLPREKTPSMCGDGDDETRGLHHPALRIQRHLTQTRENDQVDKKKGLLLPPHAHVAIKVVPRAAASKAYEDQIRREADLLKRLGRHPHVVRLHEFVVSERNFFMVMECAPMTCLDTVLRLHLDESTDFHISERTIAPFFRQLLSALSHVHSFNIAHLDLKPDNVLIGPDGSCRLADFGLAMTVPGTRRVHNLLMCPPEIITEQTAYTVSDVWAAGVILFLILVGYFPFNAYPGDVAADVQSRIVKGLSATIFKDSNVSAEAMDLIRKLMTVSPKNRLSAADACKHTWFHKSSDTPLDKAHALKIVQAKDATPTFRSVAAVAKAVTLLSKTTKTRASTPQRKEHDDSGDNTRQDQGQKIDVFVNDFDLTQSDVARGFKTPKNLPTHREFPRGSKVDNAHASVIVTDFDLTQSDVAQGFETPRNLPPQRDSPIVGTKVNKASASDTSASRAKTKEIRHLDTEELLEILSPEHPSDRVELIPKHIGRNGEEGAWWKCIYRGVRCRKADLKTLMSKRDVVREGDVIRSTARRETPSTSWIRVRLEKLTKHDIPHVIENAWVPLKHAQYGVLFYEVDESEYIRYKGERGW